MAGICDCCGSQAEWTQSYLLATRTVVLSEGFWRRHFELLKSVVAPMAFDESQQLTLFDSSLRKNAGSATPWFICDHCIDLFICDRAEARSHALDRSEPARGGAVDPGGCVQVAAIAWEGVFGRWPSNAQRPTVRDSCDFCARKIYAGEYCSNVRQEAIDELRAAGALDAPPLNPIRSDGSGWLACQRCMVAMVAKTMRLRERGR
ncbi:hypothetical protein ABH920_003351 [Catenulispora sp. EB89]|uniref:hypothetical protein n=1 Tax=Catenulispora sp. EB89 TaxID=3156257 RepID=UPI003511F586